MKPPFSLGKANNTRGNKKENRKKNREWKYEFWKNLSLQK